MIYKYVNLSLAEGSNGNSEYSPMGRISFFTDLANGDNLVDDITYFLTGTYNSYDYCYRQYYPGFKELDGNNNFIAIYKTNLYGNSNKKIIFNPTNLDSPWKFFNNRTNGNIDIRVFHDGNVNGYGTELVFQNGMIQAEGNIVIVHENSNSKCTLNATHIQAGRSSYAFLIPESKNVEINNSNIISYYTAFYNYQTVKLNNDIFAVSEFSSNDQNSKFIDVNNLVLTGDIDNYVANHSMNMVGPIQDNWTSPTIWNQAITAYNRSDLSYLSSAFNTITLTGDPSKTCLFERQRDGVGFLYFSPNPIGYIFSANNLSGYLPYEAEIYFNNLFSTTSANKVTITWKDGNISTITSGVSASNIYLNTGNYKPKILTKSKNLWYDYCSSIYNNQSLGFDIYDSGLVSAGLIVLNDNLEIVTSGYNTNYYTLSATNLFGKIVTYEFNTPVGTFSGADYDGLASISQKIWLDYNLTSGSKNFTLYLNKGLPNENSVSASLLLLKHSTELITYYVDLSELTISGNGSELNPFNQTQFINRVKYLGTAQPNDLYKLKGEAELSRVSTSARPYTVLQVDYRKNLIFDVWDAKNYGPWIISVVDDFYDNNCILDLTGVTLKNGIIYNKPKQYGDRYFGGKLKITNTYNMWIVNQGLDSEFSFSPITPTSASSGCNIIGSTIYSKNLISLDSSKYSSSANLNITDSVMSHINLNNYNNEFANIYFNIKNNSFGETSASFTNNANVIILSANQFEFITNDEWPLLVNSVDFNQTVEWIISHRDDFKPFSGITSPPNPGSGYSSYVLYEYGLFGFLRNLYSS